MERKPTIAAIAGGILMILIGFGGSSPQATALVIGGALVVAAALVSLAIMRASETRRDAAPRQGGAAKDGTRDPDSQDSR